MAMQFFTSEEMSDFSHETASALRRYWIRNYVDNLPLIVSEESKNINGLPNLGFGKPVAVLGAAPIAPETFEMLKGLKVTTICCDKALPRVLPYFRPDFVTALNTQKTENVELEKWFADSEGMGLIVPVTVHPETVKLWEGEVYWMNPSNIDEDLQLRIQQETGLAPSHRGLNVGEFSLLMAGFLRPCEVALFGLWYAWQTRDEVIATQKENSYTLVEIKEEGETWFTTVMWLSSRVAFMEFCKSLTVQGIEIFNCSMGGMLYHPEFCKPLSPVEFEERWNDVRKKDNVCASTSDDNSNGSEEGRDGVLQLPDVRVRDAPDEHYGGD